MFTYVCAMFDSYFGKWPFTGRASAVIFLLFLDFCSCFWVKDGIRHMADMGGIVEVAGIFAAEQARFRFTLDSEAEEIVASWAGLNPLPEVGEFIQHFAEIFPPADCALYIAIDFRFSSVGLTIREGEPGANRIFAAIA